MAVNNEYLYFYYSEEHIREKNEILAKSGKEVLPGFVVVNGQRKKISAIVANKSYVDRYIDAELVAEGEKNNFVFERPSNINKAVRGFS